MYVWNTVFIFMCFTLLVTETFDNKSLLCNINIDENYNTDFLTLYNLDIILKDKHKNQSSKFE